MGHVESSNSAPSYLHVHHYLHPGWPRGTKIVPSVDPWWRSVHSVETCHSGSISCWEYRFIVLPTAAPQTGWWDWIGLHFRPCWLTSVDQWWTSFVPHPRSGDILAPCARYSVEALGGAIRITYPWPHLAVWCRWPTAERSWSILVDGTAQHWRWRKSLEPDWATRCSWWGSPLNSIRITIYRPWSFGHARWWHWRIEESMQSHSGTIICT